ncbi:MAG: cytochrome c peroxidase [Flavipsychrobacter sp.]
MKRFFTLSIAATLLFIISTAFHNNEKKNAQKIYQRQQDRLEAFISELERFKAYLPDNNTNVEVLQGRYLEVRKAFKKWEYLAEYNNPDFVKIYVNGSPLPKLMPDAANIEVVQPRGMQVLDELLYAEDIDGEKEKIRYEVNNLIEVLTDYQHIGKPVYDRSVFEAARLELVRVFTLGLTGFDVPASGSSITDAITVLETIQEDVSLYEVFFNKLDKATASRMYQTIDSLIMYLKQHNDFDNLDRLFVLKEFINPIYADILDLHQKSGIEQLHEVVPYNQLAPYNHLSTNIFSNDFLNYYKYIQLPQALNSDKAVALGRALFFDPVLSSNMKRSCASCHHPDKAFTDGKPKSTALSFEGTVDRNAPTLINCVYSEKFFHDMRSEALEDQIEHVLVSRKEFDTDMMQIIEKLNKSEEYKKLFEDCFKKYPGEKLNSKTISYAISAYVSSLRGFNSPFDKYVRGEEVVLSPEAKRGFNLFMGKAVCGTCHFAPVFNGTVPPMYRESESEVLGVPEDPKAKVIVLDKDKGRSEGRLKDKVGFYDYSFKTPSIRNIALTAPYMHNGAYDKLEDVVDFYNKGGGVGLGIVLEHQTLPFDSLSLNKHEVNDIVAFMKTLTDTVGMTTVPLSLPKFENENWNDRKVGGEY